MCAMHETVNLDFSTPPSRVTPHMGGIIDLVGICKGLTIIFSHIYLWNCEGIVKDQRNSFLENREVQSSN